VVEQRTHHQITGEPMKFLTLADWTGMVETELFAQTYKALWTGDGALSGFGNRGHGRAVREWPRVFVAGRPLWQSVSAPARRPVDILTTNPAKECVRHRQWPP
jgi:hypothetical protein